MGQPGWAKTARFVLGPLFNEHSPTENTGRWTGPKFITLDMDIGTETLLMSTIYDTKTPGIYKKLQK